MSYYKGDRPLYYVLDEQQNPVPVHDLIEWANWMEYADRHNLRQVADTRIESTGDRVSTVFLGLDHSTFSRVPLLYETMVFGGRFNETQRRWHNRQEALQGHEAMCLLIENAPVPA